MASETMVFTAVHSIIFTSSIQFFFDGVLPKTETTTVYSPQYPIPLLICIRTVSIMMQSMILLSSLRVDDAVVRSRIMKRQAMWNDFVRKNKDMSKTKTAVPHAKQAKRPRYPALAVCGSFSSAFGILYLLLWLQHNGYSSDRIREYFESTIILCVGLGLANYALYLNGVEYLGDYRAVHATEQGNETAARQNFESAAATGKAKHPPTQKRETEPKTKVQGSMKSGAKREEAQPLQKLTQKKRRRRGKARNLRRRCLRSIRRTFPTTYRVLAGLWNTYRYYAGRWDAINAALLAKMTEEDAVTGTQPGDLVFYKYVDEERKDSGVYCVVVR